MRKETPKIVSLSPKAPCLKSSPKKACSSGTLTKNYKDFSHSTKLKTTTNALPSGNIKLNLLSITLTIKIRITTLTRASFKVSINPVSLKTLNSLILRKNFFTHPKETLMYLNSCPALPPPPRSRRVLRLKKIRLKLSVRKVLESFMSCKKIKLCSKECLSRMDGSNRIRQPTSPILLNPLCTHSLTISSSSV